MSKKGKYRKAWREPRSEREEMKWVKRFEKKCNIDLWEIPEPWVDERALKRMRFVRRLRRLMK